PTLFRSVHLAIIDHRADVANWIARNHAAFKRLAHALFGRGDELLADRATENFVAELEIFATLFERFDAQEHTRKLPGAAGLLLVRVFGGCLLGDRFQIRHLRDRRIHPDAVALGAADRDVDVRPARAFEDRLLQG